jgi:prepilin-type N-terminal cleavage/methylation domain-containing protein
MSHDNTRGFTLIELMLAMTFIAVLLMAIAMTTIQIGNIYNKGITLREVNQAGRAISDDLQRSIASAMPFDVTPKVDDSPETANSKFVKRDGGGRLCLGRYSYAWNYGKSIAKSPGAAPIYNKYTTDGGVADGDVVRFAKVTDPDGALCRNTTDDIVRDNATEMLVSGDRNLVVHSFAINSGAQDPLTSQAIYAISLAIGTNDQEQLTTNDASCKPPAEGGGFENYCSVNQFDIIVRAGNRAEEDK